MAAVTEIQTVNIIVNGIDLAVPKGELVVEAVKRLGLEIPIFCYHSRMKPVGMCRMCLVETGMKQPDGTIRMMPKPAAACTLPVSEGLVINTDSEMVHRDRKGVLEFLLVNHPLDCPICDRGGECPLQNNTLFYGPSTSRFLEMKRHAPKAFPLSDYVTLDLERCIQCARCVRFTEEISGDSQLAFRFRGANTQPSTFELSKFTSKFSGNVIEICPVGALTNRKYRFRARPWDLETKPGICTQCSNGCNIWFDHRAGKFVRVNGRTNEAVNEEWTCDKGKFGHEGYNALNRLTSVFVRHGSQLVKSDWQVAFAEVLAHFNGVGKDAAFLIGPTVSNEGLANLKLFVDSHVGAASVDFRFAGAPSQRTSRPTTSIAALESAKSILVFGTSLADESPIVFLRVRKAWFKNGARVLVAHHEETDVDSFADAVLRYQRGSEGTLAKYFAGQASASEASSATGIPTAELEAAKSLIDGAPVLTTTSIFDSQFGNEAYDALSTLSGFACLTRGANEQGAYDLQIATSDATAILEGAASGAIKALWLIGADPFALHADQDLVTRALECVEFLVVQDSVQSAAFEYASVAIPMTAPAEQDGTYTNVEGRIQRFAPAIPALGDAKPAWRVFAELAMRLKPSKPDFHASDVFARIEVYNGVTYADLDGEGVRVNR